MVIFHSKLYIYLPEDTTTIPFGKYGKYGKSPFNGDIFTIGIGIFTNQFYSSWSSKMFEPMYSQKSRRGAESSVGHRPRSGRRSTNGIFVVCWDLGLAAPTTTEADCIYICIYIMYNYVYIYK